MSGFERRFLGIPGSMLTLLRPPGAYRAQGDTWLLAEALLDAALPAGARVLDIGCGTGALSVTAAEAGAGHVTAIDVSRRAAFATWLNARLRGHRVRVEVGDALDLALDRGPFDVVLANPPYVPSAHRHPPRRGAARAWDAGHDGRALLDRICAVAPVLLAPEGMLLLVHSALCDVDKTLHQLRGGDLKTSVVARRDEPFGPVMRGRQAMLERRGLIEPGQDYEELVVIRADRAS
jgi:release factor glutamine methyltransferase